MEKLRKGILIAFVFCLMPILTLGQTANKDDLVAALKAKNIDRALASLNEIKRSQYKGDVLPFLKAIWSESVVIDIPREILNLNIIRINVADVLVQAHNNGLTDAPLNDIRSFARSLLDRRDKERDVEAMSTAIFVLGHIDNSEDTTLLRKTALQGNDYLFRSSVIALLMMCNTAASDELNGIKKAGTAEQKRFLEEVRSKFQNAKYCSQKTRE